LWLLAATGRQGRPNLEKNASAEMEREGLNASTEFLVSTREEEDAVLDQDKVLRCFEERTETPIKTKATVKVENWGGFIAGLNFGESQNGEDREKIFGDEVGFVRIGCFGRRGGEAACSKRNTSVILERKKSVAIESSDEIKAGVRCTAEPSCG
jgi:hypothetical protein